MHLRSTTSLCVLFIVAGITPSHAQSNAHSSAASNGVRQHDSKAPWEWTLTERISARTDASLAAIRIAHEHDDNNHRQRANTTAAPADRKRIVDIIDGRRHPELFLPSELFEWTINRGLIDGWADYSDRAQKAGLPSDFWSRLRELTTLYARDLQERNALMQSRESDARRRMTALSVTMCRDRADALAQARATFGVAVDRFMYEYVAPILTKFSEDPSTAEELESQERGCR